jgi:imidazolonepropionase
MMQKVDLIIRNTSQLITCSSEGKPKRGEALRELGLIRNGGIAIKDGLIIAVGTTIEAEYRAETIVDADGKAIVPAFVDCHTHAVYGGDRLAEFEMRSAGKSYMEIMAAGGGINSTVQATRATSEEELYQQAKIRLDEMLRLGTGTAEIKTGYGLDWETEYKILSVIERLAVTHPMRIVPTFLAAHAIPSEFKGQSEEYTVEVIRMLPQAAKWYRTSIFGGERIPFFNDVFCEKNAFSLEQSRLVLAEGKVLGMGVKAHVDEFTDLGGVEMAIELGAISVDHLDVTNEAELKRLAESDTAGVFLPVVNMNLGSTQFGNARYFADCGGVLALATDINPGSAPCPSIPLVMNLATRYQRLLPSECLNACTINAAFAIGMGERVGSLEVGKQADLLILDTDDYRQLSYQIGGNLVKQVMIAGEIVA